MGTNSPTIFDDNSNNWKGDYSSYPVTEANNDSEFHLEIETDASILYNDIVVDTVASKVMRVCTELPPNDHRFVITNMGEIDAKLDIGGSISPRK